MSGGVPVAVDWGSGSGEVRMLDQTELPAREVERTLRSGEEVAEAIHSLRVRGAPAIGIAAAMGLVCGLERWLAEADDPSSAGLEAEFERLATLLLATRPTGRNLAHVLKRLRGCLDARGAADPASVVGALREEATAVRDEDRAQCQAIGRAGLEVLPPRSALCGGRGEGDGEGEQAGEARGERPVGILTHCNTGALATGGIGTALGVVYTAHAERPVRVWADETRPVLQGARLTAWELARAGVDVTVITDSMAAAVLRSGDVHLVIVGADAIAANGDVANKIGTYGLAVLAHHHGIPFYVAAPRTTFEPMYATGADIPIEERADDEVRKAGGHIVVTAAASVWNPAFDVTPAHLVTAFVTDAGVLRPPYAATLRRLAE